MAEWEAYGEHRLFGSELGEFGGEFVAAFRRKETVEDALALVQQPANATLQHARHAAQSFCHGDVFKE